MGGLINGALRATIWISCFSFGLWHLSLNVNNNRLHSTALG
nr:MAG TPA: hypothetical protein [Caudoviricetes sp.]